MADLSFQLDAKLKEPLYIQIYQRFVSAIRNKHLSASQRVPSIRSLASALNISRGTVELAYQILINEGLFEAKGSAGTFISSKAGELITIQLSNLPTQQKNNIPQSTEINPLQLGTPALDAFPLSLWNKLSAQTMKRQNTQDLNMQSPQGDEDLRQSLVGYLAIARGIQCSAEQVFITSGYRASLFLISACLLQKGDQGWFENPGYFIARQFLKHLGMQLTHIPVDQEGICVAQGKVFAPQAKFVVVTPTHQSPLNVTLSLERRIELLKWAIQAQAWIIEDDYDSEFYYQGRIQPTLKSLDHKQRVIYCGTFSKTLFPSLRLSYIVVPSTHVQEFQNIAKILGSFPAHLPQKITHQFICEGHFARHLRKMRNLYRIRRQYLIMAIEQQLSGILEITKHTGGMHIVATLLISLPVGEFISRLHIIGIEIQSMDHWYAELSLEKHVLLGFTNIVTAEMASDLCQQIKKAVFS